jgi:hypothetical protein
VIVVVRAVDVTGAIVLAATGATLAPLPPAEPVSA